ncbi:uncharacterized protein LOC127716194 [Mytilus californianus]|uniref:uncharacterized protein LOC127716194 n=1 Tax=Mytilus californianus TaxID=6549 RepID=UPI00224679EC|nr:uncharacterized protein LOC127716194 [Mytilus californianus]
MEYFLYQSELRDRQKEDIEWRISFSVGEKFLINTFTHTQLICYALLKILLKDVIATYNECDNLLCSYFLKTVIFWISEELLQSIWKPGNLIHCFIRCLSRLIYTVDYSVCLHDFIPENNMFENKIEGRARGILLQKFYTLHSYGWRCMLFSDQLSNFHVSMWMVDIAPLVLHSDIVEKILNSRLLNAMLFIPGANIYKPVIHQIVSCDQSSNKYLHIFHMSLLCAQYAQSLPLNSNSVNNKYQYLEYNSCRCTLLQNIYHDAVSGWVMLASFFCKTKQNGKDLYVIMYSISKFTPEKLYWLMGMSDNNYRSLEIKSFKKSIVQLLKIMVVDDIIF